MPGHLSPAALPRRLSRAFALAAALFCYGLAWSCNSAIPHAFATAFDPPPAATPCTYAPDESASSALESALLRRFAPLFVVAEGSADWNRIGQPTLHRRAGIEWARVELGEPTVYAELRRERVGERELVQCVYRIHFDQFACTASHFASLHRNAGLLVLVTVDEASEAPLFVTSVHTCGCWLAISATEALDEACLPEERSGSARFEVGGESLPACLAVPRAGERFLFQLATRTHRVEDVRVCAAPHASECERSFLRPMDELRRLPIEGAPGETGSFFYERGFLRGHVRGAWAPIEGLTLGLLVLDPRLGMDKDFGDPEETGARFYTAILPWRRERSRLDRFGKALELQGFRTELVRPRTDPGGS